MCVKLVLVHESESEFVSVCFGGFLWLEGERKKCVCVIERERERETVHVWM